MQDTALMLHTLLELGESMLADGADVRRVEQTLTRMGLAYGAVRMDVFVITSSIVLTMCFPDETSVTQTRRIEKSAVTDFRKLEAINAISRSYCEKPFPVQELADRLHLAKRCRPARWKLFAGSCLGAGALTVFFGGAGADGLAAAVFALALCLLQMYLPLICKNKVLFNFLAAFCVGSLISLACRALPALHGDKIIIGDIMLLIPGLAFTNAVKDIFIGDTISGVMRLIETVLWAAALALGLLALTVRALLVRKRLRQAAARYQDPDCRMGCGYILCAVHELLGQPGLPEDPLSPEDAEDLVYLEREVWYSGHTMTEDQRRRGPGPASPSGLPS